MFKKMLLFGLLAVGLVTQVSAQTTCLGALDEMQKGDAGAASWYWDNCNIPTAAAEAMESGRNTRAATNIDYATFKSTYNGTLTAAQIDGVVKAFNAVLFTVGSQNCYSFDPNPASGATGFASAASSTKSFCATLRTDGNQEKLTFGTLGTTSGTGVNGSFVAPGTGQGFTFGSTPDPAPASSHVIVYLPDTMAALAAADTNATAGNVNTFITQAFACGTAAKALTIPAGCVIGDATTDGEAFTFKISATTGSWSLTGMKSTTYIVR